MDTYHWEIIQGFWDDAKTDDAKKTRPKQKEDSPERTTFRPPPGLLPPMPSEPPPSPPHVQRPPPPTCTPKHAERHVVPPLRGIADHLEKYVTSRAHWRRALDAGARVQSEGRSFAVVVSSGRFVLLDIEMSEAREELVDAFGCGLGRHSQLLPGDASAGRFFGTAMRTVVGKGSYLNVEQGEHVEICARRVVLEAGKAWVAAKTEGSEFFLWLDLADAGL